MFGRLIHQGRKHDRLREQLPLSISHRFAIRCHRRHPRDRNIEWWLHPESANGCIKKDKLGMIRHLIPETAGYAGVSNKGIAEQAFERRGGV